MVGPGIVSVVIVAYKSAETIEDCVRACATDPAVAAVVVVDNSSDEMTKAIVSKLGRSNPAVSYVANSNEGFSKGCNLGARHGAAKAPVLAFINPDVFISKSLRPLAQRALHGGIVGGDIVPTLNYPWLSCRPLPSRIREAVKAVVGPAVYRQKAGVRGDWRRVGQLMGALLVINVEVFKRLGGFDERFELYYEDVDICERASQYGGCTLHTETYGLHVGGVSSSASSGRAYVAGRISRIRYWRKRGETGTDAYLALLAVIEFVARSVARRSEGQGARRSALSLQFEELRRPGSVTVLR
ncbi:hypothetical protein GCM10009817_02330 [Terrabacter lapilli]|uniref:Glycosyltransferase 2-like domain-containing protein n=1 Tax=Terrabacter lapilli TaxID=436231 RepID=A0ABN2RA92_9MICO